VDGPIGEAADLVFRGWRGKERGDHHDDRAGGEEDAGRVEEVEIADRGQEGGRLDLALAVEGLECELDHAEHEAAAQGPDSACGVDAFPEEAEEEDRCDGRRQVALHALEVLIEAAARDFGHDGNPDHAQSHDHGCGDASDGQEVFFRLSRAQLFVDVDSEEGGAGVEERGERAHEGGEQARDDQAADAGRQQELHEGGKDQVAVDGHAARNLLHGEGDDAFLVHGPADHAGDEEDQDRPDLQQAAKHRTAPGGGEVLGGERPLDDVLVGAPVPEADDGGGDENAEPGEARVRKRAPQGEVIGVGFAESDQFAPAAEFGEADGGDDERADRTELLLLLYKAYKETAKENTRGFDSFLDWAPSLLNDIGEIDENLIDPATIFNYLNEIKAISLWNINGEPLTEGEKNYLGFYNSLSGLYNSFTAILLQKRTGHRGLAYRKAVNALETGSRIKWKKVIFIGLYALNTAEKKIIFQLKKEGIAETLWDSDHYYLENNSYQEAGKFLKANFKALHITNPLWISDRFKSVPKKINIYGTGGTINQVKLAGNILKNIMAEDPNLNHTNLVLADETLLLPQLNSLPLEVKDFNVTMGYPLAQSPVSEMFGKLINFWISEVQKNEQQALPKVNLFSFLDLTRNRFLYKAILIDKKTVPPGLFEQISSRLRAANIWLTAEEIISEYSSVCNASILRHIFQMPQNTDELIQKIVWINNYLLRLNENDTLFNRIDNETLLKISQFTNDFQKNLTGSEVDIDMPSFYRLFNTVIRSGKIPFYGEPLLGLQIMGMLETRTLDFDNIILVGANEGVLPASGGEQSFIPFEVKTQFGLLGKPERDAIYAYHFYRLIQNARNVTLIYNTQPDNFGGSEKSRFIQQITEELPLYNPETIINEYIVGDSIASASANTALSIPKTGNIISKLKQIANKGLSATSVDYYRICPFRFYLREIAGVYPEETDPEKIDQQTIGTVVHEVLKWFFADQLNISCNIAGLRQKLKIVENTILEAFSKYHNPEGLKTGQNFIILKVVEKMLLNFLNKQLTDIENYHLAGKMFKITALEKSLNHELIPGKEIIADKVVLKGIIDLIEIREEGILITDYKTGNVNEKHLKIAAWDHNPEMGKAFQLMFYSFLVRHSANTGNQPVNAGIYPVRKPSAGLIPLIINEDEGASGFDVFLQNLIHDIFDPAIEFYQTTNTEACKFCDYKTICNKN